LANKAKGSENEGKKKVIEVYSHKNNCAVIQELLKEMKVIIKNRLTLRRKKIKY